MLTVTYKTLKCRVDRVIMASWQATLVMITVVLIVWFYAVFITHTGGLLCFTQIKVLSGEQQEPSVFAFLQFLLTLCLFSPNFVITAHLPYLVFSSFFSSFSFNTSNFSFLLSPVFLCHPSSLTLWLSLTRSSICPLLLQSCSDCVLACNLWLQPLAVCLHWFALWKEDVIVGLRTRVCVCVCVCVCPCCTFTPILWSFCDLSPGVRQHNVSTRRPQLRFLCASFSATVMSVSFPLCRISTLYKAVGCLHSVCHVGYMQGYNYLKKKS